MRQVSFSKPFLRDYRELPAAIQNATDESVRWLIEDPRHPSLQMKKMQPKQLGIWEARVTQGYRLTFSMAGDTMILRRVGTHDILRTP